MKTIIPEHFKEPDFQFEEVIELVRNSMGDLSFLIELEKSVFFTGQVCRYSLFHLEIMRFTFAYAYERFIKNK